MELNYPAPFLCLFIDKERRSKCKKDTLSQETGYSFALVAL